MCSWESRQPPNLAYGVRLLDVVQVHESRTPCIEPGRNLKSEIQNPYPLAVRLARYSVNALSNGMLVSRET